MLCGRLQCHYLDVTVLETGDHQVIVEGIEGKVADGAAGLDQAETVGQSAWLVERKDSERTTRTLPRHGEVATRRMVRNGRVVVVVVGGWVRRRTSCCN